MQATIRTLCLSTVLILAACSEQQSATQQQSDAAPGHYNTSLDMQALMALVVEPVADTLWSTAGWVLSDAGYEELYPTTDEGWDFAYKQSAMVVEIGNMLALPDRAESRDNWLTYSQALSTVGEMAMKATAEQNEEDYFQAGAQLYSVCTACHQAYNADIVSRFISE
jgi:hypothetical protein